MYEIGSPLDFLGILWYHKRVKLGCYATAPHGFDSGFRAVWGRPAPRRDRVTAGTQVFLVRQ